MSGAVTVREYAESDIPAMRDIWNEVVRDGIAFPQTEELSLEEARAMLAAQSRCAVALNASGEVIGMYILHPNNVGRCSHIANASYAVASGFRGIGAGDALVRDSLEAAKKLGFKLMQFNAVVKSNHRARGIYERLGFNKLGMIPKGFRMKDGHFEDIVLYYAEL